MDLFKNILQQWIGKTLDPVGTFLAGKSTQPTQSPITSPTQAPMVPKMTQKQAPTLFSDEKDAYDRMMADNVPESDAMEAIKSRRSDLMWGNTALTKFEEQALVKMRDDGMSAQDAAQALAEHRDAMKKEAQQQYQAESKTAKIGKWIVGAWLGALSTVGSSTENLLGWGAKKLGFESLWNELQAQAWEYQKAGENISNDPAYSTWVKAWNILWGWAMMIAAPWPTGLLGKSAWLGTKILAWAGEGALQGAWTDIATTGKTSLASTIWNAALGWALPVVAKWFEKLSTIPVSKIIPTTPSQAGKDIQKWLEIGKAIRDTGFSLTKGSLLKKVESKVGDLSGKIDDAITSTIRKVWPKNITMNGITKGLKDSILKDPSLAKKLQGTPIDMQDIEDGMNETITAYKKLYGAKKLDLAAQQQLKKDIYNWLSSTFAKADTAKLSARQVVEKQLAKTLKEGIESAVPEVKWLNAQLAPYMEAGKRLRAKGSYSGYLTDIIAGWFASGNPKGIMEDPVWYVKNFAYWVLAKRLGTSTAAKTWSAQILKWVEKLFENPNFQRIIINQASQLHNQ